MELTGGERVDIEARMARAESEIAALQRQYDQLQADVTELRGDVSDIKAKIGDIQLENARHFSEVKDLLTGVTNKALNSLPPWGVLLTLPLGGLMGAVVGALLGRMWG
jgi:septal ring factor EnvC (AmiA/AmiB activator)